MTEKNKYKILHVDDDAQFLKMIRIMLSVDMFDIDVAKDGSEAVTMAFRYKYDLIVMDIMMPIMDGKTASKTIKQMSPNLPILALSAFSINDISDYNIDYFLRKPVTKKVLLEKIWSILK